MELMLPTKSTSRDLILIAISQLAYRDLEVFLSSLKSSGVNAHVVCFAGDTDADTIARLRADGVEVLVMKEVLVKIPFISRKLNLLKWAYPLMRMYRSVQIASARLLGRDTQAVKTKFMKRFGRICTMRFFYYRDFIEQFSSKYDRVLLTDARDVFFQANVFANDWSMNELYCFLEADDRTIASDKWNKYWIEQIGGASLLSEIGSQPISCAGVTFAATPVMRTYLQKMCKALEEQIDRLDLDQGFHNVLIWKNQLPAVRLGHCFESEVLTVGLIDESKIRWSSDNKLLNRDGSVIQIVHQYDRHPLLTQHFGKP